MREVCVGTQKVTVKVSKVPGQVLLGKAFVTSPEPFGTGQVHFRTKSALVAGDQALERLRLDVSTLENWR